MRKINYKTLAAAMIAIQIAVTAMPASALACENDRIQETAQEQVEVNEESTEEAGQAEAEEPEEVTVEAETKEEAETMEETAVEETGENFAEETVEAADETVDVTEDEAQSETAEQKTEEQAKEQELPVEAEKQEETKKSEEAGQGKAFEQTVTVDGVRIRVSAEEGTFEDGARLSVVRVPSKDLKEVENAVADARAKDELVTSAYAFDIKILGQDGSVLQPAGGKKIKVSFETKEAADGSLGAVVYHLVNANNNITAKKLATTINRDAKTAEAQTDGLSYYVVEFVSKARTDENNTSEVKKEKKTETEKKTSVTEKKSENNKKKETEKKENTDSKKTDKSKTNGKKSPKTGDTANMVIWLTMGALAAGGIIVLLVFRRRLS